MGGNSGLIVQLVTEPGLGGPTYHWGHVQEANISGPDGGDLGHHRTLRFSDGLLHKQETKDIYVSVFLSLVM